MLTLGFSPCPNDTFIFDALVNKKIDTEGLEFEVHLEDVQTLNEWAIEGRLNFTKISYGVLPLVLNQYIVLNAGGALGMGVGPLLITHPRNANGNKPVSEMQIAIPGVNTTANLLFSMAYPDAINKTFLVFHEIEEAVLSGKVDAGVIIHENRFTYLQKGLVKITDLGDYWEQQTGYPIPLGCIAAKRTIETEIQKKVDVLIQKSIRYAFDQYPQLSDYIRRHAQEMSEAVMRQHINLYVNDYSVHLGEKGKAAVKELLKNHDSAEKTNNITDELIFVQL
jgi:1,4-dihydroxy-6-naphthoate synthase